MCCVCDVQSRPLLTDELAPQVKSDHRASHGADQAPQGSRLGEGPHGSFSGCMEAGYAQTWTLGSWSNQKLRRGSGGGWLSGLVMGKLRQ